MTHTANDRIQNTLSEWNAREVSKGVNVLSDNSVLKVECYELPLTANLILGSPPLELEVVSTPQTIFTPNRAVCNSPSPFFVMIRRICTTGKNISPPHEPYDSYDIRIGTEGLLIRSSGLRSDDSITVSAFYTGLVPDGFVDGTEFPFVIVFSGSHTIVQSDR